MPACRYFGAFVAIVALLYGLIFFTGTDRTPQLGLDLRGGTTVTLTARTPDGQPPAQEELELARQIIEQRVNGLGVAEAEVVTEGDSNIVISVPGDDGEQARELGADGPAAVPPGPGGAGAGRPGPSESPEATDGATPTDRATPTDSRRADRRRRRRPTPPPPTDSAAPTGRRGTESGAPDPDSPPVTQEEAAAAVRDPHLRGGERHR